MKLLTAALAALLLSACGGGGDSGAPPAPVSPLPRALVHASARVAPDAGYALHMQPLAETDIATSVQAQSRLPGSVILWAGDARGAHFARFDEWLAEARKYPSITHAYVFDELFWMGDGIEIGRDEAPATHAAHQARTAGLKPVVVLLSDVILAPDFKLADINAFAVLAIDIYPSARPTGTSLGSCRYNDNPYSNLLYCSIQKLRAQGFAGDVWYVFQAFGVTTEPLAELEAKLTVQRQTVRDAARLGAAGLAPWGLHLSADQMGREPVLFPLSGHALERLVSPDNERPA